MDPRPRDAWTLTHHVFLPLSLCSPLLSHGRRRSIYTLSSFKRLVRRLGGTRLGTGCRVIDRRIKMEQRDWMTDWLTDVAKRCGRVECVPPKNGDVKSWIVFEFEWHSPGKPVKHPLPLSFRRRFFFSIIQWTLLSHPSLHGTTKNRISLQFPDDPITLNR